MINFSHSAYTRNLYTVKGYDLLDRGYDLLREFVDERIELILNNKEDE